jgi:uncharacterized protein YgiM (DUF1202 family)
MSRGYIASRPSLLASRLVQSAVSIALAAVPGFASAQAQDVGNAPPAAAAAAAQDVENSRFAATGIISSNAVYVRCGPGDNYYPTQKLDKGAKVKVVGAKFDWLKIEPPEGSFCYVAKLYVDRHGDGKVGRVTKDSINVRAGSHLSALKIGILCELHQGEEVEITGEEQEYFKINPPKGAYLFVNKRFVDPDPQAQPIAQAPKPETQTNKTQQTKTDTANTNTPRPDTGTQTTTETAKTDTIKPIETDQAAQSATSDNTTVKPEVMKPGETTARASETTAPDFGPPETSKTDTATTTTSDAAKTNQPDTTQVTTSKTDANSKPAAEPQPQPQPKPVEKTFAQIAAEWNGEQAEAAFDKAEADYFATRNQPMSEQPIESLVERYEALSRSDKLPESMRRVAEARLPGLQARATARSEIARLRASEDTLRQKQIALKAEQEELQRRISERTVQIYIAVGTLQPSSLQQGSGGTLYRITDPATGRTVCYLRSNDKKTLEHLGQFVGVKGQINEDPRLGARVIQPTSLAQIDPAKVHTTITAHIIPPSLIPREASTDPIN